MKSSSRKAFVSYAAPQAYFEQDEPLLDRGLICWSALTQAEKFVCLSIILAPLWWFISWSYTPLLLTSSIFAYQLIQNKRLGLSRPSISVISLMLFTAYSIILYRFRVPGAGPSTIIGPLQLWGTASLLLWYIQSHRIRVRLLVVAWGLSVVVLQAIVYWLFAHFILSEPYYTPSQNLMARVTNPGEIFNPAILGSVGNFLAPYYPSVRGVGGLIRYAFFFSHPTITGFFFGSTLIIALSLKNRLWSSLLIVGSAFLILLCQSRNIWLVLPVTVLVHWLIKTGKTQGLASVLAIVSIISFVTLSIPQVTNSIVDRAATTAEATGSLRKNSTEDRQEIYTRTWETVVEELPVIGYSVPGIEVTPGYEYARVGTESFILGTLLYKSGFLGTAIFLTFLTSFLFWLHQTRRNRPLCCFLVILLLGLASAVTEFSPAEVLLVAICAVLYTPSSVQNPTFRKFNHG